MNSNQVNPEANPGFVQQYETAVQQAAENPGPMIVNRFNQRFIHDPRDASGGSVRTIGGNNAGY